MSTVLLPAPTSTMSQSDMYTGIVVAILFVIGVVLGIVKLLQERSRKLQIYLDATSPGWRLREAPRKYTLRQKGLIGLAMLIGVLLGVAATLFTAYSTNWAGIIPISSVREAHTGKVRPAAPKIGTSMNIQEEEATFPPFYYMTTSIYNEGELAAKQLSGHWKLFSPDGAVKECEVSIEMDSLLSTPYQSEPCLLQGPRVLAAMSGESKIRFQVDIEFDYFGISKDQPQHYSAQYQYDPRSHQMTSAAIQDRPFMAISKPVVNSAPR